MSIIRKYKLYKLGIKPDDNSEKLFDIFDSIFSELERCDFLYPDIIFFYKEKCLIHLEYKNISKEKNIIISMKNFETYISKKDIYTDDLFDILIYNIDEIKESENESYITKYEFPHFDKMYKSIKRTKKIITLLYDKAKF